MKLRSYQQRDIQRIREAFKTNKRVLYVLPTGGGKTVTFNHIAGIAPGRVLILVHRKELLNQAVEKFGGECGTIEAGKPTPDARVIVGMVQTVVNRINAMFKPSLIIIDEAHHANATTYQRITNAFPCFVLGVTATPCRADGSGLKESFDTIVEGPTMSDLIDEGYLVKPRCFAPTTIDTKQIKIVRGDFDQRETLEAVNRSSITGDVVKHYKKFANERPAVVFCISVQHAVNVAEVFRDSGISSAAVYGDMSKTERDETMQKFGNEIAVLCSCNLISEGVDVPGIYAAILLRPTQSKGLFLQQVGRALRPAPGKTQAIILDHVGNCQRHGLPTDGHEWTLDAKKRRGRVEIIESVHQCEECFYIYQSGRTCPECGHEREPTPREIEQREGELKEIESTENRKQQGRARGLDELIQIAKARGYKTGWAYMVYNARKKNSK